MLYVQHAQPGQSAPVLVDVASGPAFAATPKWFLPNIFKYHVLLHDVSNGNDKRFNYVLNNLWLRYIICHPAI